MGGIGHWVGMILLENLWALAGLLIAIELVLVLAWSQRRTWGTALAAWIGLALIPTGLLLSVMVETRRENVEEFCQGLARAVDEGEVETIAAHLAEDFHSDGFDRGSFLEIVEQSLTRFRVDQPRLHDIEIVFQTDASATVALTVKCQVRSADVFYDRLPTRWRLNLRRSGESWRVVRIEAIPIPPLNLRELNRL